MIGKRISLSGLFPFAIHGLAGSKPELPEALLHFLFVISALPFLISATRAASALPVGDDTRSAIICDQIVTFFPFFSFTQAVPCLRLNLHCCLRQKQNKTKQNRTE
jgi:hypothetical protein